MNRSPGSFVAIVTFLVGILVGGGLIISLSGTSQIIEPKQEIQEVQENELENELQEQILKLEADLANISELNDELNELVKGQKEEISVLNELLPDIEEETSLESQLRFGRGLASGFFVSDDGCIITNAHVTEQLVNYGKNYALIYLPIDSDEYYYYKYAEILKVGDPNGGGQGNGVDLTLLKINNDDPVLFAESDSNRDIISEIEFIPVPITLNTRTPEEGEIAMTVGHPQALGEWIPIMGNFIEEDSFGFDEYIFDLSTFPGNSGGPILNSNGELIGVAWGGMLDAYVEDGEYVWYWPIDNTYPGDLEEVMDWIKEVWLWDDDWWSEEEREDLLNGGIITPFNIGLYLDYVGYFSTFAETSTTVEEFLKDTPCSISTSNESSLTEWEENHFIDLFEKAKYQVVAIDPFEMIDLERGE